MTDSLASGLRGSGKDGDALDSADVRADRPKNTSGNFSAQQTTGRKNSLAVVGSLLRQRWEWKKVKKPESGGPGSGQGMKLREAEAFFSSKSKVWKPPFPGTLPGFN